MERMNTGAQPAAKVASQPAGAAAPQSASQRPVVRLEHARKAFGGNQVLNDISLSVSPGEVVAIIGPSGGGKSTLLRCMTLLERLDGGGLWYGGFSSGEDGELAVARPAGGDPRGHAVYGDKGTLAQARQRFGLVFQSFNLFPMSVMRNIMTLRWWCKSASARRLSGRRGASSKKWVWRAARTRCPVSFPAASSSVRALPARLP